MSVFQTAAFHILSADIENKIHLRAEVGRRLIMGNRFHLTQVDVEGFFQEKFAVSRDSGFGNKCVFRQDGINFFYNRLCRVQRAAFIVLIAGVKNFAVIAHNNSLDRR